MMTDEAGIICSYNSTVYEDTLQYAPELVKYSAIGFPNYKTNSFVFSAQWILTLLNNLFYDTTLNRITKHIISKYYSNNIFVDLSFEINLKKTAISSLISFIKN